LTLKTHFILVVSLYLILGPGIYGQELIWENIYGGSETEGVNPDRCIRVTNDGSLIIAAYAHCPIYSNYDILLLRLDQNGDTLWSKIFGGEGYDDPKGLAVSADGGFIVTGSSDLYGKTFLLKTDSLGNYLWSKSFPYNFGSSVEELENGNIAFTGSYLIDYDLFIALTDSYGNLIWLKIYGGVTGDGEAGFSIWPTQNNEFIIGGYTHSIGDHIWVLKTDSLGDTIWTRTLGPNGYGGGYSICQSPHDGNYYVTGGVNLSYDNDIGYTAKIDNQGNLIWENQFGGDFDYSGYSICPTYDGGAILTGINIQILGDHDPYLIRFYRDGEIAWSTWLDHSYDAQGRSLAQISPDKYIIAGIMTPPNTSSDDIYIACIADKVPLLNNIYIHSDTIFDHVINHNPIISWDMYNYNSQDQDSILIQVGVDSDWEYAEMWDSGPIQFSDTSIYYDGASLLDGEGYFLRLRVKCEEYWSEWSPVSFHMNDKPAKPILANPTQDKIVNSNQPYLYVYNSTDSENDSLAYEFIVAEDSNYVLTDTLRSPLTSQDFDSTEWQVADAISENTRYWWKARAYDGHEYSDWSDSGLFWVNATEEPPTEFDIISFIESEDEIVFDMLPTLDWQESIDPDPYDSVFYSIYISIDSNFTYVNVIDGIWDTTHTLNDQDSLQFGTQLWVKVEATDVTNLNSYSSNLLSFRTWKLGDANSDWQINILDITFLISYLYKAGSSPFPIYTGDINGSCSINILDVTYLINYLYKSGPDPNIGCEL